MRFHQVALCFRAIQRETGLRAPSQLVTHKQRRQAKKLTPNI
jgi:hypothetical protein